MNRYNSHSFNFCRIDAGRPLSLTGFSAISGRRTDDLERSPTQVVTHVGSSPTVGISTALQPTATHGFKITQCLGSHRLGEQSRAERTLGHRFLSVPSSKVLPLTDSGNTAVAEAVAESRRCDIHTKAMSDNTTGNGAVSNGGVSA